jgi:anti-sigma regulatory factor (Ser/Thr protein kinase)
MDIGRRTRTYTFEPITPPVPTRVPIQPARREPLEVPAAPEPVPAVSARLRFPADPGWLADARDAVRRALRRERWDAQPVERVVLAVSEALMNAIEHGSVPGGWVEVGIAATAGRAEIRVTDRGRPGAPPLVGVPAPPPPSSARGRGLAIANALADALEIRGAGHGTEVRLDFTAPVPLEAWIRPESPASVAA